MTSMPYDTMEFPVLGFTPDGYVEPSLSLKGFTQCRLYSFDNNSLIGIEVVDAGGAAWRITGVEWVRGPGFFSPGTVVHEVEQLPAVSLEEIKERICRSMDTDPNLFCQSEMENGEWKEPEEVIEREKATIRAMRSIAGICQHFGDSWSY